jgi:integrase
MSHRIIHDLPGNDREVLAFEEGVTARGPATAGAYWRLRWTEYGRRKDTTARTRAEALAKAEAVAERLAQGTPTAFARAKGADLVAHYLDPARPPARGRVWSERHREDQESHCRRFVTPAIGAMAAGDLTRADFQRILDAAPTESTATNLRRCLSALVGACMEEGLLLSRQDVLRGVRRRRPIGEVSVLERTRHLEAADIPTAAAVHALAGAAAETTGVWWRELQVLLVAYSGLRWGEMAALTADRLDPTRRRISVDRQLIETRRELKLGPPKNRRRRITMYPARTPMGVELAAMVERRLAEVSCDGPLLPSPRGQWARRSNYGRNVFGPAATAAGWPRRADGRWAWTFHSLRHVFATWALSQPGARIEDVSRLLGHSSVRVTQDIYVNPDGDLYERFFEATA